MFALRDIYIPSDWFVVFTLDRGPDFHTCSFGSDQTEKCLYFYIVSFLISSSLGILWSVSLSTKHSFIFSV